MRMPTVLAVLVLTGLCWICRASAQAPAVPLQLTLSAEHTHLLAASRGLRHATGATPRLDITPVKISLAFANTGAAPLTVNLHEALYRFHADITGPSPQSCASYVAIDHLRAATKPVPADFVTLAPGASYTVPATLSFPGAIGDESYILQDFGAYHLRFTYQYLPAPGGDPDLRDVANPPALWQGAVASNDLTLHVVEAGSPQNGLRMGLDAQPDPTDHSVTRFTGVIGNITDAPIAGTPWDAQFSGLTFFGDDGKPILVFGVSQATRQLSAAEGHAVIPAHGEVEYTLLVSYLPDKTLGPRPTGHFSVMDRLGVSRDWNVAGDRITAQASYTPAETPATAGQPTTITSPRIVTRVDVTAYRVALLKAKPNLSAFSLVLSYDGYAAEKPFYTLRVQVPTPPPVERANPFNRVVQISEQDAATLIDNLATMGVLREAESNEHAATPPTVMTSPPVSYGSRPAAAGMPPVPAGSAFALTGYVLRIHGAPESEAHWVVDFGWDWPLAQRLDALNAVLPDKAKPDMALLLGRLSGLRAMWEAQLLLQRRLTVSLTGLPLTRAADQVNAAVHSSLVRLTVAKHTPEPTVDLQFRDIPLRDVFVWLGHAAGYQTQAHPDTGTLALLPPPAK